MINPPVVRSDRHVGDDEWCESIRLNYKRKCFWQANKLLRHHSHYLNGLHHSVRHHSLNPIMMKLVIDEWKQKSHDYYFLIM
jgi:hypothetical protein